jgi:hypothetical protein
LLTDPGYSLVTGVFDRVPVDPATAC